MYCIKCGVRLADTESRCPLCNTRVYHPEILCVREEPLYPADQFPPHRHRKGGAITLTAVAVLALITVLVCDLQLHRSITWSGYAAGALMVLYTVFALPLWFSRPNPVIFVPCGFAAAVLYLLYVNFTTSGNWFFSFALPVTLGIGSIVTTLIALLRYVRRGRLYTVGGCTLATGVFMLPLEMLLSHTFCTDFIGWSVYPLTALTLLGGYLIFLGICRRAREAMARKFFF